MNANAEEENELIDVRKLFCKILGSLDLLRFKWTMVTEESVRIGEMYLLYEHVILSKVKRIYSTTGGELLPARRVALHSPRRLRGERN